MMKITSVWPHQNQIKIEWNLGKRCNFDCTYCPSEIHDNYSPHTDIKILEACVDRLCELDKPLRLSLTGGEPCVHPNIENLLNYLKKKSISWINITTNGTRGHKWYLDNEIFFNHIVFSLHFEQDWIRSYNTILKFCESTKRDFFVNIMAHHTYIDVVKDVVKKFDESGIKYAIRRIRWTEGDHNVFDDLKYDETDLKWILQKESTVKANCRINDDQLIHANDIIKNGLNQFKGWTCHAGIESLMINWNGEVFRATCRVGGTLGNIYSGTFSIPLNPVICSRDWCTCAADIPLTKEKND